MNPLLGIVSVVGDVFKWFFNVKEKQADVASGAIKVLGDISASNAQREQAIATIISSEANAGGIAASWRPIMMYIFMGLLLSFWFGWTPPHLTDTMPPVVSRIFDIIQIGLCGYIPARTIEKIVSSINISSVLKALMGTKK